MPLRYIEVVGVRYRRLVTNLMMLLLVLTIKITAFKLFCGILTVVIREYLVSRCFIVDRVAVEGFGSLQLRGQIAVCLVEIFGALLLGETEMMTLGGIHD